jgi:hypothetical protein
MYHQYCCAYKKGKRMTKVTTLLRLRQGSQYSCSCAHYEIILGKQRYSFNHSSLNIRYVEWPAPCPRVLEIKPLFLGCPACVAQSLYQMGYSSSLRKELLVWYLAVFINWTLCIKRWIRPIWNPVLFTFDLHSIWRSVLGHVLPPC